MSKKQTESIEIIFEGIKKNIFIIEGRTIWKFQSYPSFLKVNETFYGDSEDNQTKYKFWLHQSLIQPYTAFKAKKKENGKIAYQPNTTIPFVTNEPCKWGLKMLMGNTKLNLYNNFNDDDAPRVIENFLLTNLLGRLDENSTFRKQRPNQIPKKVIIIDRLANQIVFEYPTNSLRMPDYEQAKEELNRVCKHFRKTGNFPPQEHYSLPDVSEQEFKSTPKVFKEDTTDYSLIFLQMKEAMYSELVRLGLAEYIADVANIKFHSFQNNSLKCFIDSKEQFEKLEEDKFLVVFRSFLIRFFCESVKLEYALKIPIQKSETQPKITETEQVEVERSEVAKTPKSLKSKDYFKNPDKVFDDMMIEFFRTIKTQPIEFQEIKLKFQDVEKMICYFTLPSEEFIEAFNTSEFDTYFRLIVRKYFDSSYKVQLRHEPFVASIVPSLNKI